MLSFTLKYIQKLFEHPFYRFSFLTLMFYGFYHLINLEIITALYLIVILFPIIIGSCIVKSNKIIYLSLIILTSNIVYLNKVTSAFPNVISKDKALIKATIIKINQKDSLKGNFLLDAIIDSKNYPRIKRRLVCYYYGNKDSLNVGERIVFESNIEKDSNSKDLRCFVFCNRISIIGKSQVIDINDRYRKYLNKVINKNYCVKTRGIAYSVLSADKSKLDKKLRREFSNTGIAHILSLSGLHISIIVLMCHYFFGIISKGKLQLILSSLTILTFLFLIDYPISAVRASFFTLVYLYLVNIERNVLSVNILIAYVLLSFFFNPNILNDISFQMSNSAVLGILLYHNKIIKLSETIIKKRNTIIDFLINSLSISLSASLFLNIIIFYHFEVNNILSPLLNMIIVPMFSLSLIYEVFALFGLNFLFQASDLIYDLIININSFFSR